MTGETTDPQRDARPSDPHAAFSPGAPITAEADLVGRAEPAQRLRNIVLSVGEHAVILGERGIGKTSLALTFWTRLEVPGRRVQAIHVTAGRSDFDEIWRRVFRRLRHGPGVDAAHLDALPAGPLTVEDVELALATLAPETLPVILLDEIDQADAGTATRLAALIKSLSDHAAPTTLVLVGDDALAGALVEGQPSVARALKQVALPRLPLADLESIVAGRLRRCGLRSRDEALFQIGFLSRGFPYFAQLIGRHAAIAALEARRRTLLEEDVFAGLVAAVREVDTSITQAWQVALGVPRAEPTLYEAVLVACALADSDEVGRFSQAAVATPLAAIAPRTPPYTATTFAFHMNEMCDERRGRLLDRTGEPRNFRYFFRDPMMQPYVVIRALESGRLSRETFDKFAVRRQRALSV